MPDTEIPNLAAITAAGVATDDLVPIVDVSDTTMSGSGTAKKIRRDELQKASLTSVVPQGQQTGTDVQAAINNLDTRVAAMLENGPDFLQDWAMFYDDFLGNGAATGQLGALGWMWAVANGGLIAVAAAPQLETPGFVGIQSGTTSATANAYINLDPQDFVGHPPFVCEWRCQLSALVAAGTQEFTTRFGLIDNFGILLPTDGYCFEYNQGNTDWRVRTAKAGTTNVVGTGVTADTNWHRFRITSDGGGSITYTIDGASPVVESNATYVPTTAEAFGPCAAIQKTVGTAQRQLRVDYFYLLWGCTR